MSKVQVGCICPTRHLGLKVKGYRFTLNQVFALKEMDLSFSQEISMLIKSFVKSCAFWELRPPKWDMFFVFCSLSRHPQKPLNKASDKNFTLRTLFLLTLASTKWVGELHGLSAKMCHLEGRHSLSFFFFMPNFTAKTQKPSVPDDRFYKFLLPSLLDFIEDDLDELMLCLVRAVRLYLERTKQYRPLCKLLFIPTGWNKK